MSAMALGNAAFVGRITQAFPFLLNHTSEDGVFRAGHCRARLARDLGMGSYDTGRRYLWSSVAVYLFRQPVPATTQMQDAYDRLQTRSQRHTTMKSWHWLPLRRRWALW